MFYYFNFQFFKAPVKQARITINNSIADKNKSYQTISYNGFIWNICFLYLLLASPKISRVWAQWCSPGMMSLSE